MQHIGAGEFAALLAEASPTDLPLLLDVREAWEFELASLRAEGLTTLSLPMSEIVQRLGELDPARSTVCLCHHGVRSAQVAAFLEQRQGFASVANFTGGIDAWSTEVDASVPRY
ncbi:MAG: rhodanese-like domain-containing protein [Burkholderiaceae bacterium]|nr:rhodanese-like domain-containing protein [Burkholderiaceae bacterium]